MAESFTIDDYRETVLNWWLAEEAKMLGVTLVTTPTIDCPDPERKSASRWACRSCMKLDICKPKTGMKS